MSPFCVAKTMAITRMLQKKADSGKEKDAVIEAVLEVWYSASWRKSTVEAFREAVIQVLREQEGSSSSSGSSGYQHPVEVLSLLRHWQTATVSLAAARKAWMEGASAYDAASLTQKEDRQAFVFYAFSGDVLPAQADSCGNLTMFAVPPSLKGVTREREESIFRLVPLQELIERRATQPNIVAAAVQYLREGVTKIQQWLSNGEVSVEVRMGTVEPGSPTLSAIRSLSPASISWNNVLDYMSPSHFHSVAVACSAPHTLHFAYSMNWAPAVKGARIVDYPGREERFRLHALSQSHVLSLFQSDPLAAAAASRYLLVPPVQPTFATLDWYLPCQFFQQWVDAFFQRAPQHAKATVLEVRPPAYHFIIPKPIPLQLTFTYEGELKGQQK
jgi:hypothetical protein